MMQFPSPYLYTGGNPVNRTDPSGMCSVGSSPLGDADPGCAPKHGGIRSTGTNSTGYQAPSWYGGSSGLGGGSSVSSITQILIGFTAEAYDVMVNGLSFWQAMGAINGANIPLLTENMIGSYFVRTVEKDFIAAGWGDVINSVTGGIRYSIGKPNYIDENGQKVARFGANFILDNQPTIAIYRWNFSNYFDHFNSSSPYESIGRTVAHELLHQMTNLEHGAAFNFLSESIYKSVYYQ